MSRTLHIVIGEPPRPLRKARLDNIALVPASLLPLKATYQPLANKLPKGSILLVQTASPKQKKILANVTAFFRIHGKQAITMPIEQLQKNLPRPRRAAAKTLQLAI